MGKEKLPEREQIIKTLRVSKEIDDKVNELAAKTGASYNSTACLLIYLGLHKLNLS